MTSPLYLHIGLQKTGTSYLQAIFWGSQEQVAAAGLDLVPGTKRDTFGLMLDVRDRVNPEVDPPSYTTAVQRLPGQLAAARGRAALISQESLASANDKQIERLLEACAAREVHVVVTVRDLARQIPSAWQEGLKTGNAATLDRYVNRLRRAGERDTQAWRQKDVAGVLARWSRHLPADRIHVVTVPPSGSDPTLLLNRFCEVLDLDPALLDVASAGRGNRGLALAQAEVLRRVNERLPDDLKRRVPYGEVGKRFFAMQVLAGKPGRRILLGDQHRAWCDEVSAGFVEHIKAGGYDVVGDLDDLLPRDAAYAAEDAAPSNKELLDVATQALADVLTVRMRHHLERRQREVSGAARRTGAAGRVARVRARLRRR